MVTWIKRLAIELGSCKSIPGADMALRESSKTTPSAVDTTRGTTLLSLPNELLLMVSENLDQISDISTLAQTNRWLANLLSPVLHNLAQLIQAREGITPLQWAAMSGDLEAAEIALQNGCYKTCANFHALHRAVEGGHEAMVKLLLENGADVNWPSGRDHITPLLLAVRGNVWVPWFIKETRRRNLPVVRKWQIERTTPGYDIARDRQERVIKILLSHGADVNQADIHGRTPLHRAAVDRWGEKRVVKTLIEAGANILARNNQSLTPADKAIIDFPLYRYMKRREWVEDHGFVYAMLVISGGYPYSRNRKYRLVRLLYCNCRLS